MSSWTDSGVNVFMVFRQKLDPHAITIDRVGTVSQVKKKSKFSYLWITLNIFTADPIDPKINIMTSNFTSAHALPVFVL